ncbi:MAG: hypothetical protein GY781_16435 [Gammaproteobacteria bacterium]|nr:hypothetical protein [Gammaproteobacteria bacterium]
MSDLRFPGQYLQSDPIGLAGGVDGYGYVGGNPVGFFDPEGLFDYSSGYSLTGTAIVGAEGGLVGMNVQTFGSTGLSQVFGVQGQGFGFDIGATVSANGALYFGDDEGGPDT